MLLCEFILNSTRAPPGEEFLYHPLLELHLMGHEDTQPLDVSAAPQTTPNAAAAAAAADPSADARASASHQSAASADSQQADQVRQPAGVT